MSVLIFNASANHLQEDSSGSEIDIPDETMTKTESTADLLTIFSPPVTVNFKSKMQGTVTVEKGRWCSICK